MLRGTKFGLPWLLICKLCFAASGNAKCASQRHCFIFGISQFSARAIFYLVTLCNAHVCPSASPHNTITFGT